MPVSIIRATPDRYADWARMLARLHAPTPVEQFLVEVPQLARLPEPYVAFLALDAAGEAVGLIDARVRNYAEGAPDLRAAYVEDLWVEPALRRRGIAAALLRAVEGWALDEGLDWLGSDAIVDDAESAAFHAAAGFAEIERLVIFGKPLRRKGQR